MKFRLLGNQEVYLNDTCYWYDGCSGCGCRDWTKEVSHDRFPEPVNGVIDWPENKLWSLVQYARLRADNVTFDSTTEDIVDYRSSWAESNSLLSLARRLEKALKKAEGKSNE